MELFLCSPPYSLIPVSGQGVEQNDAKALDYLGKIAVLIMFVALSGNS